MSFKERFFLTPHPSIRTRIGMSALLAVFVLLLMGVWVDFITHPDLYYPLVLIACPAVALAHMFVLWSGARAEGRARPIDNPAGAVLAVLGCVVMLGFAYVPVVTKAVPYLITQATGEQYEQEFRMWTESGRRKRKCRYRLTGGPMHEIFSSHLCISRAAYEQFPDQRVAVGVIGRRGPLGMTIDRIQALGPVGSP